MNRKKARELLLVKSSEELYRHARRVEKTAFLLAEKYNINKKKAALAGLLHDYGKTYDHAELLYLAREQGILLDGVTLQEPALLHAPVGAWLLEHEQGLRDREILEAVRWHTIGGGKTSFFARLIYLADIIEPGRHFPGVQEIRKLAFTDGLPQQALLAAVERSILFVLQKGGLLHSASIALRNNLLLILRENKQEGRHG